MSRPQKERTVYESPLYTVFKPSGVSASELETVQLSLDEYEAIRLADHKQMDHEEAAGHMDISRSTFTRLLGKAHVKMASFIVEGKQLCIDGGCVRFVCGNGSAHHRAGGRRRRGRGGRL